MDHDEGELSRAYVTPFNAVRNLSIVEMLIKRPAMFTAHGSLAEVIAYLEGYEAAPQTTAGTANPDSGPSIKEAFEWLAEQCGGPLPLRPLDRLDRILARFETEAATFEALNAFTERYRETKG